MQVRKWNLSLYKGSDNMHNEVNYGLFAMVNKRKSHGKTNFQAWYEKKAE